MGPRLAGTIERKNLKMFSEQVSRSSARSMAIFEREEWLRKFRTNLCGFLHPSDLTPHQNCVLLDPSSPS